MHSCQNLHLALLSSFSDGPAFKIAARRPRGETRPGGMSERASKGRRDLERDSRADKLSRIFTTVGASERACEGGRLHQDQRRSRRGRGGEGGKGGRKERRTVFDILCAHLPGAFSFQTTAAAADHWQELPTKSLDSPHMGL